jgi:hypothetical protein
MFIGHYAVAFAAKRVAPRTSLGTLIAAAQFLDLLWPIFLFLGWEEVLIHPGDTAVTPLTFWHYPISHSLVMAIAWATLFAAAYMLRHHKATSAAIVLYILVLSHWFFDFISHRPDMPLTPQHSSFVGLGLWRSVAGTLIIELAMFAAGFWLYASTTRARNGKGKYGLAIFVVALIAMYLGNLFGPPPPSPRAIEWLGLSQWLIVPLLAWIDHNREPVAAGTAAPSPAFQSAGSGR